MAVSGLNIIMSGVKLIGDLIQYGEFSDELFITLMHVCIIFWLAAELYGLRLERAKLRHKNAILADALAVQNQRIKNEHR